MVIALHSIVIDWLDHLRIGILRGKVEGVGALDEKWTLLRRRWKCLRRGWRHGELV